MLNVVTLSVTFFVHMLIVVMLNVVMLSVITLSVVAVLVDKTQIEPIPITRGSQGKHSK